ncbi:hypothetical protein ACI789_16905 [Geodermatophilus sp. SYSU D00965]
MSVVPSWRADDALVHLVFAAVDGLVFQQVCLDDPAAAQSGVRRLRTLLQPLTRPGHRPADRGRVGEPAVGS